MIKRTRAWRRERQRKAERRVRHFYVRVCQIAEPNPRWNPRACSCDMCRASDRARAERRARRAPTVRTELEGERG